MRDPHFPIVYELQNSLKIVNACYFFSSVLDNFISDTFGNLFYIFWWKSLIFFKKIFNHILYPFYKKLRTIPL